MASFTRRSMGSPAVFLFDLVLILLIGILVIGGVPYHSKIYLKHSADVRRVAIAWGIMGAVLFPSLRVKSLILLGCTLFYRKMSSASFRWNLFGLVGVFAAVLSILQTRSLRVPLWDVGIFHQVLYSLNRGLGFQSSLSEAGDFLTDHFSPSLILLVPFFRLASESAYFLPLCQVFLLFGGGAAWIFYAERIPHQKLAFRNQLAGATCLFFLSFNSIWMNLRWGFHENAIGFFCLSWFFCLFFLSSSSDHLKKRFFIPSALMILLWVAAGTKEIVLLDVALVCFVWAFSGKKSRRFFSIPNLALFLFGILFIGVFLVFESMPHPAGKNYFVRYYSYLGEDLKSFLTHLLWAPILIFENVGAKELFRYVWTVFGNWLFLPILIHFGKKVRPQLASSRSPSSLWIVTLIPSLTSAALATYPPLRSDKFHYVLELWPVLAFVTLNCLSLLQSSRLIVFWAVFQLFRLDFDPWTEMREAYSEGNKLSLVRQILSDIPESESVAADELSGPWVCNRRHLTRLPDIHESPTYFVINQRISAEVQAYLNGHTSHEVWTVEGWSGVRIDESISK